MTVGNAARQRQEFNALVARGTYSEGFDHAPAAVEFVRSCVQEVLPALMVRDRPVALDCGCGTGIWLAHLHAWAQAARLARLRQTGFDLADGMVEVARGKLEGIAARQDLRTGDLGDPASFAFAGAEAGFDLILAYDVVQQLPPRSQLEACLAIVDRLAPGGTAIVFDNEKNSAFGRRMAVRKLVTRHLRIPLVPRYYCNAAYPPLERFRARLAGRRPLEARIVTRDDGVKRALMLRAAPAAGHV